MSIKTHFSAEELAQMSLQDCLAHLGIYVNELKKVGVSKRKGVGGGLIYPIDNLPHEAQQAIRERCIKAFWETNSIQTQSVRAKHPLSDSATNWLIRQCPAFLSVKWAR
jgi:putative transposase